MAETVTKGVRTMLAGLAMALMLWAATAVAADFEDGCAAFERGDYAGARDAWAPLAERGHPQAQFRLGCLYAFGQGVPEDHALALRLYRLAAEQGDADAQNNLGGMYAEGMGVAPDLVEAYKWFELAARRDHEMARRNRAFIGRSLSPEQIAAAERLAHAWQAAHR